MSLQSRVAKIEGLAGRVGVSERQYLDAEALIGRHSDALFMPDIFDFEADPEEVALMQAAENSGRIKEAKEVVARYWRARGVDIEARRREIMMEVQRRVQELFGDLADE